MLDDVLLFVGCVLVVLCSLAFHAYRHSEYRLIPSEIVTGFASVFLRRHLYTTYFLFSLPFKQLLIVIHEKLGHGGFCKAAFVAIHTRSTYGSITRFQEHPTFVNFIKLMIDDYSGQTICTPSAHTNFRYVLTKLGRDVDGKCGISVGQWLSLAGNITELIFLSILLWLVMAVIVIHRSHKRDFDRQRDRLESDIAFSRQIGSSVHCLLGLDVLFYLMVFSYGWVPAHYIHKCCGVCGDYKSFTPDQCSQIWWSTMAPLALYICAFTFWKAHRQARERMMETTSQFESSDTALATLSTNISEEIGISRTKLSRKAGRPHSNLAEPLLAIGTEDSGEHVPTPRVPLSSQRATQLRQTSVMRWVDTKLASQQWYVPYDERSWRHDVKVLSFPFGGFWYQLLILYVTVYVCYNLVELIAEFVFPDDW